MDDDYVNISTEDTPHDGAANSAAADSSDLLQNDTTTQEFATIATSNERVDGSMSPCIEEQDYTNNTDTNDMNIGDEDDRKPAAKPSNNTSSNTTNTNSTNKKSTQVSKVDNRFTCAICLENVSDEPVVTKCGHLYCWHCLYQWLEPGMMLSEYNSAFGGNVGSTNMSMGSRSYNVGMGIRNNSNGSSSSSGGLNFLSTSYQTTTNNIQQQSTMYNDRPYNPSGGQFSQRKFEQRRHCPVCKAACTVDSVIPIYLTGLGGGSSVNGDGDSSMVGSVSSGVGDTAGHEEAKDHGRRRQSVDSLDSLDVDNSIPIVSAAQSSLFATSTTIATTPDGSPSNTPATDTLLAMELEDPTNSNLGLRQRRRGTKRSSPSTTVSDDKGNLKQPPEQLKQPSEEQQKYECKSPTRTSDTSGILDSEYRRQENANNNFASHDNTPTHRNSIDFVDGITNDNGMENTSGRSASNVPSRPIPNYPIQPQNTPMSQLDLINDHTTLNESISPNMTQSALSSPFRLALRPRHPSLSMGGGTSHQQRPATHAHRQRGQSYSQTYLTHSHHRHHGRLTSALLGIVDTIDNLANNSTSSGAVGQASTTTASVVPTLHRSDGGMGGIGRASEVHQNGNGGDPIMMSEEESSLANAREFLSRLLLMLACFVILCLLLF